MNLMRRELKDTFLSLISGEEDLRENLMRRELKEDHPEQVYRQPDGLESHEERIER